MAWLVPYLSWVLLSQWGVGAYLLVLFLALAAGACFRGGLNRLPVRIFGGVAAVIGLCSLVATCAMALLVWACDRAWGGGGVLLIVGWAREYLAPIRNCYCGCGGDGGRIPSGHGLCASSAGLLAPPSPGRDSSLGRGLPGVEAVGFSFGESALG